MGPGLQEYELQTPTSNQKKGAQYIPSAVVGSSIIWQMSDQSHLKEQVQTTSSKVNTRTSSNLTLTTKLFKSLDLQIAYTLTYDSKPVDTKKKTNTVTTLQLVYNFV